MRYGSCRWLIEMECIEWHFSKHQTLAWASLYTESGNLQHSSHGSFAQTKREIGERKKKRIIELTDTIKSMRPTISLKRGKKVRWITMRVCSQSFGICEMCIAKKLRVRTTKSGWCDAHTCAMANRPKMSRLNRLQNAEADQHGRCTNFVFFSRKTSPCLW